MLGMSQERLGGALGLTFQQVQKYERGANRISASRLHDLTSILDVPVSFFFEGIPPETADQKPSKRSRPSHSEFAAEEVGTLGKRETLELVRAYYRIGDATTRHRFFQLV
ncbi:MAG: helix-turn-helix transcriptional regulator, partial [Alphaproteobacteria bacterium]